MSSRTFVIATSILALLTASGCRTAPKSSEGKADIVADAERALADARQHDPSVAKIIDRAQGIAVFPKIGKGAVGVGGAYGKGVVFEQGQVIGYCDMTQASVGLQLGGQTYTEMICFEDQESLERFKNEDFTFNAQASAVVLDSGAGANAAYRDGICVITMDESGLMLETALGGQKFGYEALEEDARVAHRSSGR